MINQPTAHKFLRTFVAFTPELPSLVFVRVPDSLAALLEFGLMLIQVMW